jgi:hypothetical protein
LPAFDNTSVDFLRLIWPRGLHFFKFAVESSKSG